MAARHEERTVRHTEGTADDRLLQITQELSVVDAEFKSLLQIDEELTPEQLTRSQWLRNRFDILTRQRQELLAPAAVQTIQGGNSAREIIRRGQPTESEIVEKLTDRLYVLVVVQGDTTLKRVTRALNLGLTQLEVSAPLRKKFTLTFNRDPMVAIEAHADVKDRVLLIIATRTENIHTLRQAFAAESTALIAIAPKNTREDLLAAGVDSVIDQPRKLGQVLEPIFYGKMLTQATKLSQQDHTKQQGIAAWAEQSRDATLCGAISPQSPPEQATTTVTTVTATLTQARLSQRDQATLQSIEAWVAESADATLSATPPQPATERATTTTTNAALIAQQPGAGGRDSENKENPDAQGGFDQNFGS